MNLQRDNLDDFSTLVKELKNDAGLFFRCMNNNIKNAHSSDFIYSLSVAMITRIYLIFRHFYSLFLMHCTYVHFVPLF